MMPAMDQLARQDQVLASRADPKQAPRRAPSEELIAPAAPLGSEDMAHDRAEFA